MIAFGTKTGHPYEKFNPIHIGDLSPSKELFLVNESVGDSLVSHKDSKCINMSLWKCLLMQSTI